MSNESLNLDSPYDCLIVGGGPAGLTCAIFLARYLRRVLVLDDGKPRNYASQGIHGFLGQHGIQPGELLQKGRDEARAFGAEFYEGRALSARRVGDMFEVETESGVARGRRIVLAYGLRDILPDIPRMDELYGKSIFHCPDCDGYEVRNCAVGVIGKGKRAAGLSLKLLQWTSNITILTNGEEHEISAEEMSKLQAEMIRVDTRKIGDLVTAGDRLQRICFEDGEMLPIDSIFFTIGVNRSSDLAEQLGCNFEEDNPCVSTDNYCLTSVEGVYAIGDLQPGSQLAITSAASGAIAAIQINKTLLPPARQV